MIDGPKLYTKGVDNYMGEYLLMICTVPLIVFPSLGTLDTLND